MCMKFQGLLLASLLILISLPIDRISAYEPLVTIGKPPLYDILYSPDGRFLATLTYYYLEILDAETYVSVSRVPVYENGSRLAFSPDSSLIAISGYDEGIQIWHVDSEKFLVPIPVDTRVAEFSPDGKYVAYADGKSVFLWDIEQGKNIRSLTSKKRVRGIAFHPDGRLLAIGLVRQIALWDPETGETISQLELEREMDAEIIKFSHDGSLLAAIGQYYGEPGPPMGLWDLTTGDSRYRDGDFSDLAFTMDDQILIVGGKRGNLHIIDLGTFSMEKIPAVDRLPPPNTGGMSRLKHLTVHPDGSRIASLINDSRIRVWDTQNFSRLQTLYGYGWAHSVADALYLPKVNRIVTGEYTDVLHFWDATTGELLKAVEFYSYIDGLSASPDGAKIAMAVEDTSQIWDAAAAKQLAVFDPDCSPAYGATAFSPSGEHFVYLGMCGSHFWDAETGAKIAWDAENALEKEHMDRCWTNLNVAVFSSDGKQFVAIPENFDEQPKTMVWDFETGLPVNETRHVGPVVDVGTDFLQAYQVNDTVEVRFLKSDKLLSRISDDFPEWSNWEIFSNVRFHPSGNVLGIRHHWHSVVPGEFRFYNVWSGEMIATVSDIMDLQFAADGSYMFLVDDRAQLGLYRTSEVIGKSIPSVFAVNPSDKKITTLGQIKQDQLLQNYPNPFNPETWIPYQLGEDSIVTVTIYDSVGQVARILNLGYVKSGNHRVHWDGRDNSGQILASGIYFYVLKTDDGFSDSRKMVLLR